MTNKQLRDLYCGDINNILYGDRDTIEVSVNQSIPQKHGVSTWYQRINHRFPVKSLAEVEAEVISRLKGFLEATTAVYRRGAHALAGFSPNGAGQGSPGQRPGKSTCSHFIAL